MVHIRFSVPQCAKVANYSNMKGSRENHIHFTATKTVNNVYICQHLISTIGVFFVGRAFSVIGCIIWDSFSLHTKDTCLERHNFCVIRKGVNGAISKEKFGGMAKQNGRRRVYGLSLGGEGVREMEKQG